MHRIAEAAPLVAAFTVGDRVRFAHEHPEWGDCEGTVDEVFGYIGAIGIQLDPIAVGPDPAELRMLERLPPASPEPGEGTT